MMNFLSTFKPKETINMDRHAYQYNDHHDQLAGVTHLNHSWSTLLCLNQKLIQALSMMRIGITNQEDKSIQEKQ